MNLDLKERKENYLKVVPYEFHLLLARSLAQRCNAKGRNALGLFNYFC